METLDFHGALNLWALVIYKVVKLFSIKGEVKTSIFLRLNFSAFKNHFAYLAMLDLCCFTSFFSSSREQGCSLVAGHVLLIAMAFPASERGL